MNTTTVTPTITVVQPSDGSHEFTRLNVIGTFLALQLCQLTQPYGSLLFLSYDGGLWRCNPLASFAEACIIFYHLGLAIFQSRGQNWRAILRRLQVTSAVLLLVRTSANKDDGDGSMARLMAGTDQHTEAAMSPLQNMTTTVNSSHATHLRTINVGASDESQDVESSDTDEHSSTSAHFLRKAFGSNALAHKELRIDSITAFTEFVILLKLVAVRGSAWFTTAGTFLIFGWFSVQILLLLLHHREISEAGITASIGIVKTLKLQLRRQDIIWLGLFAVLHLPFFGYLAYLAAFHPWYSENTTGFLAHVNEVGLRITFAIVNVGAMGTFGWGFKLMGNLCTIRGLISCIVHVVLHIWWFTVIFSKTKQRCVESVWPDDPDYSQCMGNATSLFKPNTVLYYVVDKSYDPLCNTLWMITFLALISYVYVRVTIPIRHKVENDASANISILEKARVSSLSNTIFVLVVFLLYLLWYDSSNTYRPTWVDVLG